MQFDQRNPIQEEPAGVKQSQTLVLAQRLGQTITEEKLAL
jgi:hypothetical protein